MLYLPRLLYGKQFPLVQYRNIEQNNPFVQQCWKLMDRVPSCFWDVLIESQISIAFFGQGQLTDQPEMRAFKGKQIDVEVDSRFWDNISMVYNSAYKKILVGFTEENVYEHENKANFLKLDTIYEQSKDILHEIGHAIDFELGPLMLSTNFYFSQEPIFLQIVAMNKNKLDDYFIKFPSELFANSFQDYYASNKTKEQLMQEQPEIFDYLENIIHRASTRPWWLKARIKNT